jgi:hypothetical protein
MSQYNNLSVNVTQNYKDIKQKHNMIKAIILRLNKELKMSRTQSIGLLVVTFIRSIYKYNK